MRRLDSNWDRQSSETDLAWGEGGVALERRGHSEQCLQYLLRLLPEDFQYEVEEVLCKLIHTLFKLLRRRQLAMGLAVLTLSGHTLVNLTSSVIRNLQVRSSLVKSAGEVTLVPSGVQHSTASLPLVSRAAQSSAISDWVLQSSGSGCGLPAETSFPTHLHTSTRREASNWRATPHTHLSRRSAGQG